MLYSGWIPTPLTLNLKNFLLSSVVLTLKRDDTVALSFQIFYNHHWQEMLSQNGFFLCFYRSNNSHYVILLFSCFTKIQPMWFVSTNVHVPSAVALQSGYMFSYSWCSALTQCRVMCWLIEVLKPCNQHKHSCSRHCCWLRCQERSFYVDSDGQLLLTYVPSNFQGGKHCILRELCLMRFTPLKGNTCKAKIVLYRNF